MRNYMVAALMAAAVGSSLQARSTTVQQIVQSGASGWSHGSGPDGSYNFNVWETTRRGADGQAQAYTHFSVGRQLGSGTWESISGSGYIPASAVKTTGTTLHVEMEDLNLLPDYYLTGMRCDMFSCVPFESTAPSASTSRSRWSPATARSVRRHASAHGVRLDVGSQRRYRRGRQQQHDVGGRLREPRHVPAPEHLHEWRNHGPGSRTTITIQSAPQ